MWSTYEEVEEAIYTIKNWIDQNGTVPEDIIIKYKKMIMGSSYNFINYFYERLEHEVPEVLLLFLDGYIHKPK